MGYSASSETVLELQETELGLYSFLRRGILFTATADAPCTPSAHLQFLSFMYYLSFIYPAV